MEKYCDYNGVMLSYHIYGTGMPVMLIHGFAEDTSIWQSQVALLQNNCCLIVPNIPGSGGSQPLPPGHNTIEEYSRCMQAIVKAEKIEKCVVLGHSMGGYITLAFAELFPGELLGYGLVHSTAFADSAEKKEVRIKGIKLINEYGVLHFLKNTTPNLFSKVFKQKEFQQVEALITKGKQFAPETLIHYYQAMMNRPDRTEILSKINVPVLFILGAEDVAAPVNDLLKQVHLPKKCYIHLLKEAGHMSMMEKPAELYSYLNEFLQAVKAHSKENSNDF